MSQPIPVFVSSGCYELRDIRAAIREFLKSFNIQPMMSDDPGFPHASAVKPYVTCLDALAECPLVIGVLEKKYGRRFDDWGHYPEYNGLSPTHAEFKHALRVGAKFLPYVHRDTISCYEMWRKDKDAFEKLEQTNGVEIDTLMFLEELKQTEVAPWIIQFTDSSDIVDSLKHNLINEIWASLKHQRQKTIDGANYFVKQYLELSPTARHDILGRINPDLVVAMESIERERDELRDAIRNSSQERENGLRRTQELDEQLSRLQVQFSTQETMLALAAARDASWLHVVRTRFMPKQPGAVPFHNAEEVALRGFHVGPRKEAVLESVTWSSLPYNERGLHRGYTAGLIFRGKNFSPGIAIGFRYPRDKQLQEHIHWHTPNIYFGDYLEISANDDALESPLGYRHAEFCVKNPLGHDSPWIGFTYAFDDEMLAKVMHESLAEGRRLVATNEPGPAVDKLRKAMVFAKNLLGHESEETIAIAKEWNDAIDSSALGRLRFRVGDKIRVVDGEFAGQTGEVTDLALRHLHAYGVTGIEMRLRDDQIEPAF